jgi:hypothetical protein
MNITHLPRYWIVQRDGHPAPNPEKHLSEDAAIAEARRLAAKMNDPKFAFLIYQFIGAATIAEPNPPTMFEYADPAPETKS